MKDVLYFLKYHNAATVMMMAVLLAGSSFAASPDLRNGLEGAVLTTNETIVSIDNTKLLNTDLDDFDASLQIRAITEDDESYYVTYAYKTLAIEDSVWKEVTEEDTLKASKALLAMKHRDLGLYVAEELGEVAAYELSYLREVQTKERERGESRKVASIAYAGLIGKFLEPKEKTFPGYEPVVPSAPEPAVAPAAVSDANVVAISPSPDDQRAMIKEMVAAALAELLPTMQPGTPSTPAAPIVSESQPEPVAHAPPAETATTLPAASPDFSLATTTPTTPPADLASLAASGSPSAGPQLEEPIASTATTTPQQ